jgi:hypothetical protein
MGVGIRGTELARQLFAVERSEPGEGPWLRGVAAVMALAAGVIHLAQVGIHLAEGWMFVAFFIGVGVVQLGAAVLLVRPRSAGWFWFGIGGTGLIIAVWIVSRWLGLPFGAEPGRPEALGTADAAATLAEAVTIVVLSLWLRFRSHPGDRMTLGVGIGLLVAMAALWLGARAASVFDPDPRLTAGAPELADRAMLLLVIGVALMLALLWRATEWRSTRWWRTLMRGLLAAVLVTSLALVTVTLPARGGQNADCQYGPLAEVSGLSHATLPEPVPLALGQQRWLPVLVLSTCSGDPVQLTGLEPLSTRGLGARLVDVRVLAVGQRLSSGGAVNLPDGAESMNLHPAVAPGQERQVVVLLRGVADGTFNLDAVSVRYLVGTVSGQFNFATSLGTCSPGACQHDAHTG